MSIVLAVAFLATAVPEGVSGQVAEQVDEVLTNNSVLQLVQSKLARKLIIAKIRDSRNAFDVTAAGLVGLHAREVPKQVIEVMLETAADAAAQDALSNQAVVQMVDAKLPRDLIIAKIQSATPAFDLTTSGLVGLQQRKVPKPVIEAMLTAGNSSSSLASVSPASATPPAAGRATAQEAAPAPAPARKVPPLATSSLPSEAGIYVRSPGQSAPGLVRLEPTAYSATKTGSLLGSAMTYGIAKAKMKAVVRGARAAVQVSDAVEFYFVFDKTDQGMGPAYAWLSQVTSPNEFSLIRFDVKKNAREVVVGALGAYSMQHGTDEKAVIPFSLTRLGPGRYRVVPDRPLPPGQYAFITESGATPGAAWNRVFDFGIIGR